MKNKGGCSQSASTMNAFTCLDNLPERHCNRLFCAKAPVLENRFDFRYAKKRCSVAEF